MSGAAAAASTRRWRRRDDATVATAATAATSHADRTAGWPSRRTCVVPSPLPAVGTEWAVNTAAQRRGRCRSVQMSCRPLPAPSASLRGARVTNPGPWPLGTWSVLGPQTVLGPRTILGPRSVLGQRTAWDHRPHVTTDRMGPRTVLGPRTVRLLSAHQPDGGRDGACSERPLPDR